MIEILSWLGLLLATFITAFLIGYDTGRDKQLIIQARVTRRLEKRIEELNRS